MKRRHIHIHEGQTADIGRSTEELLKLVKDPGVNEKEVGAALQLLATRGINPKTGEYIGRLKALKVIQGMGENAPG